MADQAVADAYKVYQVTVTPGTRRLTSERTYCSLCFKPYIVSRGFPFTNMCPECLLDNVTDLVEMADHALAYVDPDWSGSELVFEVRCPLCHRAADPSLNI